jgi:hypothetical protein
MLILLVETIDIKFLISMVLKFIYLNYKIIELEFRETNCIMLNNYNYLTLYN